MRFERRRWLSLPLGLLFFLLLLLTLVVLETSGPLSDPDYYVDVLRKADVYQFVMVDVVASALDEVREVEGDGLGQGGWEDPLTASGLATEQLVASVNAAVPPEWVQSAVEELIREVGGYIVGQRDEFEVTVPVEDRVDPLIDETRALLLDAGGYVWLVEEMVIPGSVDLGTGGLPRYLGVEEEDVTRLKRRAVDSDWTRSQVEEAFDQVAPYIVGREDGFEVEVDFSDRADIVMAELATLVEEADPYDLVRRGVVHPTASRLIGPSVDLPVGVSLSIDELALLLGQAASPEWVQERVEAFTEELGLYITARSSRLELVVDLSDVKSRARAAIAEAVRREIEVAAAGLPPCPGAATLHDVTSGSSLSSLPPCLPSQMSASEIVRLVQDDVEASLDSVLGDAISDRVVFTDADLRQALMAAGASKTVALMEDVRRLFAEGWSHSDAALREDLDRDAERRLDDIRRVLADGWTYTHLDLRRDLEGVAGGGGVGILDRYREGAGIVRALRLLLPPLTLAVLAAIVLMGARSWRARIGLGAAHLLVSAGVLFVAFWLGYGFFLEPRIDDASDRALSNIDLGDDFDSTALLLAGKLSDLIQDGVDDVFGGVARWSMLLALLGVMGLAASLLWDSIGCIADRSGLLRRETEGGRSVSDGQS